MTIQQLKEMTKREYAIWFANAKANDLKEVLNNENLGGGISKFTKAMLIEVVMDLVEGIATELTSQLKEKTKRKPMAEEVKMFREMMKPEYYSMSLTYWDKMGRGTYFEGVYEEERAKYLKMIKYFHPDKPTGDKEKFREIQEAWEMAKEDFYDILTKS